MVRTVNPKAKATPNSPMPTFGNAAARTALPHPPKTSQNVPMNSAVALLLKGIKNLLVYRDGGTHLRCKRPLILPPNWSQMQLSLGRIARRSVGVKALIDLGR